MAKRNHTPERGSAAKKCATRTRKPAGCCKTRSIKVGQSLYRYVIKDPHHSAFDQVVDEYVPWVQLKGKYLLQAGFTINQRVTVKIMQGCIVLLTEES